MVEFARLSMQSSHIITLWRRYIMNLHEIQQAYGTEISTIEISRSNMVQFDFYVILRTLYILESYI